MKKKIFTLIASMLLSTACYAQNTTVTATVVDGDSVTWANATWTIDFVPGIQFPNPAQYSIQGSALNASVTHQTGTLSSAGALSVVVYDSSIVTPTGSGWRLNICPISSGSCVTYQFTTAGASQNISSNLTTLIGQPRFTCVQNCYGYSTLEAIGMKPGAIFYNQITNSCSQYSGTLWGGCVSTSGPISTGLIAYFPLNENSNSTSTFFDLSGYANNLTQHPSTSVTYTAGPTSGPCVSSYYPNLGTNIWGDVSGIGIYAYTSYISISACFKTSTTTGNQTIVSQDTGSGNRVFQLRTNNTAPQFLIWLGGIVQTINGTSNITDGKTHEIFATYNAAQVCIYIDGAKDTCSALTGTMTTGATTTLAVGQAAGGNFFFGNIWNVRIWNVPISATDIALIYSSGK